MKRGFVRTLWGVRRKEMRYRHRIGLDNNFRVLKCNPHDPPFTAYIFGEDNYKQIQDMGFNCKLVDPKPVVWDMNTEQFRHKLEALKCGMADFDEIVYLDWDTQPIKPLPDNFWEILGQKAPIQASLRQYFRARADWREEDRGKVPSAAFIYIRDKAIPDELIRIWEEIGRPFSEETVLMKYMETLMGGWKGIEKYWEMFEPQFFNLESGCNLWTKELLDTKDLYFRHITPREMDKKAIEMGLLSPQEEKAQRAAYRAARKLRAQRRKEKFERWKRKGRIQITPSEMIPMDKKQAKALRVEQRNLRRLRRAEQAKAKADAEHN